MNAIRKQPVAFAAVIEAALALIVAFGLDLTGEQVGAIVALSTAVLALPVWYSVTPTADPALDDGHGDDADER